MYWKVSELVIVLAIESGVKETVDMLKTIHRYFTRNKRFWKSYKTIARVHALVVSKSCIGMAI